MRIIGFGGLLAVLFLATPGYALELSQIERKLKQEPAYKTDTQEYCLLVFGETADKRVWIVRDGSDLYVDFNQDQILGELGERIRALENSNRESRFYIPHVIDPWSSKILNGLTIRIYFGRVTMRFYGEVTQVIGMRKRDFKFGRSPATAPIINFDGPLTLGRYSDMVRLSADTENESIRKTSLRLVLGSKGLGEGTFAMRVCKCRKGQPDLVANFLYPARSPGVKLFAENVPLKTYG